MADEYHRQARNVAKSREDYTNANRIAWNEVAERHAAPGFDFTARLYACLQARIAPRRQPRRRPLNSGQI